MRPKENAWRAAQGHIGPDPRRRKQRPPVGDEIYSYLLDAGKKRARLGIAHKYGDCALWPEGETLNIKRVRQYCGRVADPSVVPIIK